MFTFAAMSMIAGSALAGTPEPVVMETEPVKYVSGTLDLSYNTHFISYGLDVWGAGTDFGTDATFNPSVNLDFAVTDDLTLSVGTWFDINDNLPTTDSVGGQIQEVDFWAGLGYSMGAHSFSVTYQAWVYGGSTEDIIDLGYAYDHWLNPSFLAHIRVGEGASGGEDGVFFVFGVEPGKEYDKLSISFPVALAFTPNDFHGYDSGFGYASAGAQVSYPIYGGWAVNGGLTGYYTNDDVTGNADEAFITGNIGLSLDF
ncbi:hypothetical protein ACFSQZ_04475 [Rubritalea spongiae]|uniref:Transporter n=2 Tax=Rubritalea spongiae TaxID=430797 RepID=A0ABW5DZF8_9BACT